jgi:hypothetical protein
LIAANATFALKPGLCVRRTRFVILAPDPRHLHRCQAEKPLIGLSEFPEPLLSRIIKERRHPAGPAGAATTRERLTTVACAHSLRVHTMGSQNGSLKNL